MTNRWGLGPVFVYEWLLASRRWQMYAIRSAFVGLLLAALGVVWNQHVDHPNLSAVQKMAVIGEQFFYALIGTELTLILLAAPAATAGAVCLDKIRGTLLHLLVTDLSEAEIVLGKLAARLMPVLGLLLCSVPVLFLCTLLGGIAPDALAGAFLVLLGVAVLGCSVALTLSVWGTKTYEVLLATYLLWIVLLLAYPMWSMVSWLVSAVPAAPYWLRTANPYWLAFAPYAVPGSVTFGDFATYLGVCLASSAVLLALAVARLRPVTIRQAARPAKAQRASASSRRRRGLFQPSLDGNPVLWREWHRRRPSRWSRLVWGVYAFLAAGFSALVVMDKFSSGGRPGDMAFVVIAFQVAVGLLLVSVASPNPLAEERARGSLDVLLATPLSSRSILWGKWWGTYRTVPRLALLPFVTIFLIALNNGADRLEGTLLLAGLVLAYGAALTSLGLALATWTSRLGRAITWSVVAYVLVTLGWLMLIVLLLPRDNFGTGLAMGSPLFGTAFMSAMIELPRQSEYGMAAGWGIFWSGLYLAVAVVLYRATLATFDRCLGRMSERQQFPKPARRLARREVTPVP